MAATKSRKSQKSRKSRKSKQDNVATPHITVKAPTSQAQPTQVIRFYDFARHWTKRITPHLGDKELNEILVKDFNKYTWGRWRQRFLPGMLPGQWENCYWDMLHEGPRPRYWPYFKHAACHWLVNFALRLAMLVEPNRPWRIIKANFHSAVWDGENTLFDLQQYTLGQSAEDAWSLLQGGRQLEPGEYLKVPPAVHYSADIANLQIRMVDAMPRDELAPVPAK